MDSPCPAQSILVRQSANGAGQRIERISRVRDLADRWNSMFLSFLRPYNPRILAIVEILLILGVSAFFSVASVTAQPPEKPQTAEADQNEADLVHFGDLIDVKFASGFEYDWRGGLTPDGFLDGLNGLGEPIYGRCRSEAEIAGDIAKIYGKILRDPKAEVKIIDRSNRAVVRLSGAVTFAQRFQLRRPVHLRELLVIAGGVTDEASGEIMIFRPGNLGCVRATTIGNADDSKVSVSKGNGSQTLNITISELLKDSPAADPLILSGDIITVEKAVPIYVIGAVNNPRQVSSRSQITLTRAIASAGGLAKDAVEDGITIFRRENGESRVIAVNFGKIKTGELIDEVLKPFDIIDIPRRGAGKRQYPPVLDPAILSDSKQFNPPLRIID